MCKEYIISILAPSGNEIFKIYTDKNEVEAIKHFIQACESYASTGQKEAREYWLDLISSVDNYKYTIFRNYDFRGITKVV